MSKNQFFEKKGPFPLQEIIKTIGCNEDFSHPSDFKIYSFESLDKATDNDLSFLNSSKYQNLSLISYHEKNYIYSFSIIVNRMFKSYGQSR